MCVELLCLDKEYRSGLYRCKFMHASIAIYEKTIQITFKLYRIHIVTISN